MKRSLLGYAAIICIILVYGSCYKTGEIIPQTTCKPDSLSIPYTMYNYNYPLFQESVNINFKYDVNRRLVTATDFVSGAPYNRFDFIYDGNNNLTKINIWDLTKPLLQMPSAYFTYQYPNGTANSISKSLLLDYFSLYGNSYTEQILLTYNFNTEYQLQSIFVGNKQYQSYTYDFGGNLLADSVYGLGGFVNQYYSYSAYDTKINPGRSDRTIQLFMSMYSKNNPGISSRYILQGQSDQTEKFVLFNQSTGAYGYNANGYPVMYQNVVFADYNCLMPPVAAPGPGAAGN